jgi:hypothetical protein
MKERDLGAGTVGSPTAQKKVEAVRNVSGRHKPSEHDPSAYESEGALARSPTLQLRWSLSDPTNAILAPLRLKLAAYQRRSGMRGSRQKYSLQIITCIDPMILSIRSIEASLMGNLTAQWFQLNFAAEPNFPFLIESPLTYLLMIVSYL